MCVTLGALQDETAKARGCPAAESAEEAAPCAPPMDCSASAGGARRGEAGRARQQSMCSAGPGSPTPARRQRAQRCSAEGGSAAPSGPASHLLAAHEAAEVQDGSPWRPAVRAVAAMRRRAGPARGTRSGA
ncbi:hypothetical protein HPB47_012459 [Ixodes persulcatus]|uniref:Uncharacterized protein n=1 Tax=Ixodes persulcatus TaxID=34615 RepID=A0AC60NTI7_IXOPE|nr:hypothetical protein HPB47_012459 [Ixodes persulcatus]